MQTTVPLVSSNALHDCAHYLLTKANEYGIEQAAVDLSAGDSFSVSARQGKCESLEQHKDQSLSLTLYHKQCMASVDSTDWSTAALDAVVQKAVSLVKYLQADQYNGLAAKSDLAFQYPDLDLYHPWDLSLERAIDLVVEMDQAALQVDPRVLHTDSCAIHSGRYICYYANSLGFDGCYRYSRHQLSHSVVAADTSGKQNYSDYDVRCVATDLTSPIELAQRVATEACARLQPQVVKTQRCPVLLSPLVAKSLLSCFFAAINGHRVYRQSSFLQDCLGELIFPEGFSFLQQPHIPRVLNSAPFDDEGVRTQEQLFLDDGRFHQFICDSYAARRLGTAVTGNAGGVFNVSLQAPYSSLPELMQQMQRGFLVTDVMGQGTNMINGDYSKGASGFWVENGVIQYPVEGVTIAGNLRAMFKAIIGVGSDIDDRGWLQVGSILLEEMTVSGV
jgi:PmbA protein